jgi:hypothetical protein
VTLAEDEAVTVLTRGISRVDIEHGAEERHQDVRHRQVATDVAEAGPVDHRHHRTAYVGRHLLDVGHVDPLSAGGPFRGRCGVCCEHLNIHSYMN